jgi:beta-glucosidase
MTGTPPYRRADLPLEQRLADLLGRMTLEEKIDQLHQCGASDTNPHNTGTRRDSFHPTYGSFIVGGSDDVLAVRNTFQKRCLTESRLGIPALFAADVIHGYRSITPIPLAQACSWRPDLVERGCALAAAEARAHGIDWTFAPMVDHCVDPRWGRIAETFGESPHAVAIFAAAAVRGYQGGTLGGTGSVAACLKHYVGYGASEGGRDYVHTGISSQNLWEMHLPPFAAGIRAGARTVMSGFNDLNGIPTSANAYTLTEILRRRWGLTGPVVSDWASVAQLVDQGFAADGAEAAAQAINAGVDIDMSSGLYRDHLAAHVTAGRVPLAAIDEAVRRVLRLKFELCLFEHPCTEANRLTNAAPEQLAFLGEFAARSIVLLKNDGILPLAAGARRITLVGPLADSAAPLLGCWVQQGRAAETPSLAAALRERLPAGTTLQVASGCSVQAAPTDDLAPAVAAARESNLVILCVGEEGPMSGEDASRTTLRLAGRQEELITAVAATGKPMILVIGSGRPIEIEAFEGKMSAVLAVWAGGTCTASALADLLLGRREPAGRLAVTWPRRTGQIPLYHNMRPRARPGDQGAYRDFPTTPLYEFGHGLGYTTFAYGPIQLDHPTVGPDGRLAAEVTVTNTGKREGTETVLWFIRDPAASITRPLKELKHFEQAALAPGASCVLRFEIEPWRDLSFPDADGRSILEPGEIILMAGGQRASFRVTA